MATWSQGAVWLILFGAARVAGLIEHFWFGEALVHQLCVFVPFVPIRWHTQSTIIHRDVIAILDEVAVAHLLGAQQLLKGAVHSEHFLLGDIIFSRCCLSEKVTNIEVNFT